MNASELAFDIISRCENVQAVKYSPRGQEADAAARFLGRNLSSECFISEAQAKYLRSLMGQDNIITAGQGSDRFAAFIKTIFSEKKNKEYFLLVFGGVVPAVEEVEEEPAEDAAPVNTDRANEFAAKLIAGFVEKGWAKKDDRANAGEDYLCCWTTKAQADALLAQLPANAVNGQGHIITQACGSFCYWSKVRAASGAMLLCWMGEVSAPESTPAPAPVAAAPKHSKPAPAGKLIPLDMDIPF